jgi:hypothetical protein
MKEIWRRWKMEFAPITDGIWYGIMDNGILILGAYTGLQLDPYVAMLFRGARVGLGAIIGAAIGNTVSDAAGCLVDPALLPMIRGIAVGCVIPMIAIPIVEKILCKSCQQKENDND